MVTLDMNGIDSRQTGCSFRRRRGALVAALLGAGLGLFAVIGTGQHAGAAQPAASVSSIADVKSMLTPTLPAGAQEIPSAASTAKVGETISLRGYVPETPDAFAGASAEFALVAELPGKGVSPESAVGAGRAVVRVLDRQGNPLKGSLKNEHGLKPGAEVFVTGVVASGNGKDEVTINAASLHVPRSALTSGFFTDQPAEGARDVSEARKSGTLKVGDTVVLRGRVGGSKEPFVGGRAVFTLMGRGLKACNEIPGDTCSKPWDYCCDTKSDILANSVTVQVVDGKSQILRTDMKGRRGLKELSEVVVVGKVAVADGKAVVVNAASMYVVR